MCRSRNCIELPRNLLAAFWLAFGALSLLAQTSQDLSELFSISANYRIADWLAVGAISGFAWNQSNRSVFDYKVANVGGAIAVTTRF